MLAKLALDAGGVAAGGTSSALSSSILLSLGLTLLGEAAVVWFRSQSLTSGGGPGTSGARRRTSTVGPCGSPAGPPTGPRSGEREVGEHLPHLLRGRYVRAVRLVFLAVIVGTAFIGRPHPSLTGNGLVILVSLIVAAATQVALTLAPSGSAAMKATTVLAALSSGVVAGYEPVGRHGGPAGLRRAQRRRRPRVRPGRAW